MGKLSKYSGLTTKIRAMRGKLLTKQDYQKLAETNSVGEFVEMLSKYSTYKDVFEDVAPESIHRGELEKLMKYGIYRDFSKVYKFANMEQRKFLKMFFMQFEVELLKRVIRGMNYDASQAFYDKAEVIFTEYSDIDIANVYEAQSMDAFVDSLKGTIYYEPLAKVREYSEHTNFDYEMALDIFSFKVLWKKKKQFKDKELKNLTEIIGTDIDLINAMCIYRSKLYYRLRETQIYNNLIPINHKLSKEDTRALVEATNADEFKSVLAETKLGKYFAESIASGEDLGKEYGQIVHRISAKLFSLDPYSLVCINNYFAEKRSETSTLVKIAESIRYGYKADAILQEII